MPGRYAAFSACQVLLRIAHGLGHVQPVGKRGRDRRGECSGPVIAGRKTLPGVGAHHALARIERVDDLCGVLVRAGDQHVFRTQGEQTAGRLVQRRIVVLVGVFLREAARFHAVRGAPWSAG